MTGEAFSFILMEDLGDAVFARELEKDPSAEMRLYSAAIDLLAPLHAAPPPTNTPLFDARIMAGATDVAFQWYRSDACHNLSAEALRAIRLAMPLLQKARNVYIAIIDPPTHGPERSDPGGALSQMLSRHGVRADVTVMARTLPRVSDILNRHARDKDADLIVMGAYGHSRFRESIMGGATRHMLEVSEKPVFLAH